MRFVQPDTIVPNPAEPQGWNRYSYVTNNPVRFTDPTGHFITEDEDCAKLSCSLDPSHSTPADAAWESETYDDAAAGSTDRVGGLYAAEALLRVGAPTLKPWYFGPLPDEIVERLRWLGVSSDLTSRARIAILPFDSTGWPYRGITIFDWIFIFDVGEYGQNRPNDLLVHELVHVRQYRDKGAGFIVEYVRHWIDAMRSGQSIYDVIPDEVEAQRCQNAYDLNGYMPLGADPCNLE